MNLYLITQEKTCAPEEGKPEVKSHALSRALAMGKNSHGHQGEPKTTCGPNFHEHGTQPVTTLCSLQEVPSKCSLIHWFIHSAHTFWAWSMCKALCNSLMLEAWSPHACTLTPSISQQYAQAQTPMYPRKRHRFLKVSISTKKKSQRNHLKSEDKANSVYVEFIRLVAWFSLDRQFNLHYSNLLLMSFSILVHGSGLIFYD